MAGTWFLALLSMGLFMVAVYLVTILSFVKQERDAARNRMAAHERRHRQDAKAQELQVARLDRIYAAMRDYVPHDFDPEDQ